MEIIAVSYTIGYEYGLCSVFISFNRPFSHLNFSACGMGPDAFLRCTFSCGLQHSEIKPKHTLHFHPASWYLAEWVWYCCNVQPSPTPFCGCFYLFFLGLSWRVHFLVLASLPRKTPRSALRLTLCLVKSKASKQRLRSAGLGAVTTGKPAGDFHLQDVVGCPVTWLRRRGRKE